jgi:NAD(P)-dependent dehydrogenase (short-subunit alcohol dehydrogenase family)
VEKKLIMNINNLFSLKNKNILLTGATGHLGTSIAWGLAHAGACVYINSRSKKKCFDLVNKIKDKNLKAESAVFDITNKKLISKFAKLIKNLPLDCIINNAYSGAGGTIKSSDNKLYLESYNVSVVSAHNLTNGLLNNLRHAVKLSGDASIINIASMYGFVSPDLQIYRSSKESNPPFYGAAKAALLQWTRYAACEFASEKIRFNSISPGAFPSLISKKKQKNLIKKLNNKIPLGRIGQPQELIGAVILLSAKSGSYITGTNITLDGGLTCL